MIDIIKTNVNQKISSKEQFDGITEFLKTLNFWPKNSNPDNINTQFYFKLTISAFILFMPLILIIFHIYHFRSNVISSLTPDLFNILAFLCLLCIAIIIQVNLKEVVKSVNQLSAGTGPEQAPFNNFTLNYKKLTKTLNYGAIILMVSCSLFRLLDTNNCEERKAKSRALDSCGLLLNVYLPFEFGFFPLKQFVLVYQIISVSVVFIIQIDTSLLIVAYVDQTFGAVVYLLDFVEEFNASIENDGEGKKLLKSIVKIHQVLVSENKKFNKQCQLINMVRHFFGRLVLATSIFDAVETGSIEPMVVGVCWLIITAILESAGQIIINKGVEFERALYDTEWYKMRHPKDRKSFILLYLMAQQPLALYSGPFVQVSNATFLEILKATYSATATLTRMIK